MLLQDMQHLQQRAVTLLHHMHTSAVLTVHAGPVLVQLISDAAELFCRAVRVRLLARHCPAPAILQLYTLACCVHEVRGRPACRFVVE